MEVTEVRINPAKGGKVRAFASIVIDDCFIVNDLRVMEGREGQLFVTMPARKTRNGQMRDIAHPLNSQTRKAVESRVLDEFEAAVTNLTIPSRNSGRDGDREQRSLFDRLATRLFSEDFWIPEENEGEEEKE
jgi:stage V sporulation protein G